jgi:very-short-patch-repair endonuclease
MTDDTARHRAFHARCAAQHGLITRSQFADCGFSPSTFDRWCRTGRLRLLHPGVAAVPSSPSTLARAALAAVLAAGRAAVASHATALALRGIDAPAAGRPHVTVPARTGRRIPGVVVHVTRRGRPTGIVRVDGVPCTSVPRSLLDLGQVAGDDDVLAALACSVREGHTTVARIAGLLDRERRRGRPGVTRLDRVLARFAPEIGMPESLLEATLATLLQRSGLPVGRAQVRIGPYRVDRLLPGKVVVEVDGAAAHRHRFEADRRRDADLAALGYLVLRFTWRQIVDEPEWVVSRIRAALACRGAA